MHPHPWLRPIVAVLISLSSGTVACSDGLTVAESRIVAVTVLSDYAEVTRLVNATVPGGEGVLALEGFPEDMDRRSLRITQGENCTLHGVSLDEVRRPVAIVGAPEEIARKLDEIDGALHRIESEVLGLRKQVELIRTFRRHSFEGMARPAVSEVPVADWAQMLDMLREQEIDLLAKTRTRELERHALRAEQGLLRAQYRSRASPPLETLTRARMAFVSQAGGPIQFHLTYRVRGPSWRVRQDLRYDDATGAVTAQSHAVIAQDTGEEWQDVVLTLSTRMPPAGLRPPVVKPLVLRGSRARGPGDSLALRHLSVGMDTIRIEQEADGTPGVGSHHDTDTANVGDPTGSVNLDAEAAHPPRLPTALSEAPPAAPLMTHELNAYAHVIPTPQGETYRVPGTVTVRSDENLQHVPLGTFTSKAEVHLESIPRVSSMVYRRVVWRNTMPNTIQPSRASLFWNGDLVGVTTTDAVAPGAEWTLSFGAVPGLDVIPVERDAAGAQAREYIAMDAAQATRSYHFAYRWVVVNRTDTRQPIRVLESIPVSEAEGVHVNLDTDRSSPHTVLKEGIVAFSVQPLPHGSTPITLEYRIELPLSLKID